MQVIQLPAEVQEELEVLKSAMHQILGKHLKKILLFGSYARQEADNESDLDLIALTDLEGDELKEKREAIRNKCADLFIEYNVLPTVMLRNEKEFYERSRYVPFYITVMEEGIPIYG